MIFAGLGPSISLSGDNGTGKNRLQELIQALLGSTLLSTNDASSAIPFIPFLKQGQFSRDLVRNRNWYGDGTVVMDNRIQVGGYI
jgi:hypothetical protein